MTSRSGNDPPSSSARRRSRVRVRAPACAFAALLLIAASLLLPVHLRADDGTPYVVRESAAPCLKFRSEPSTTSNPVDCLPPGTHATEIESISFWRKVRLVDGREGWASKRFLGPASGPGSEAAPSAISSDAWLEVHFVDVGQGDGIWIHTYDDGVEGNGIYEGRNIVIDGGPDSSDGKNAMLIYLSQKAHPEAIIDALFISHPHDDHFPGADGIRRHFRIRDYYDPGFPKQGVAYPSFLTSIQQDQAAGRIERVHLGRQQFGSLDWGKELTAEVLYSYPGSSTGLGRDSTLENNASIVLRLQYGNHTFLFMGDAEGKERHEPPDEARYVEKILLDSIPAEKLKSTVLKIAHHGSETSSTLPFIRAVDPEIVVVCSGRRNFGRSRSSPGVFIPRESTLRRYCCHNPNIRIYRTDQDDEAEGRGESDDADRDNVIIRTNGTQIEVKAFESGQPFQVNSCEPACGN